MKVELENVKPMEIEKRSFEIITEELGDTPLIPGTELIVKRCIHTSADFDYAKNLCFSEGAVEMAMDAIRNGACIVTDTQMAKAGINKRALARYGGEAYCFMSDEDVAATAKANGTTRATASMDKAANLFGDGTRPCIFRNWTRPARSLPANAWPFCPSRSGRPRPCVIRTECIICSPPAAPAGLPIRPCTPLRPGWTGCSA